MFGLKRRKAAPVTVPVSGRDLLAATITRGESARTDASVNVAAIALMRLASGLPAACAHIIANDCAQAPLRLYRVGSNITVRRGKERGLATVRRKRLADPRASGYKAASMADGAGNVVEVMDHEILDLLNKPNPYTSGHDLRYLRIWFKLITGEAFEAFDAGELWSLYPHVTNPIPADPGTGELIAYYAYGRERSHIEQVPAEQVIHYKFRQHPSDPYHGYGPLHDCADSAKVLAENTAYDLDLINNGNVPAGLLNLSGEYYRNSKDIKEFMDMLAQQTSGRAGKNKLIGAVGAAFQSLAGVDKDLQTAERIAEHKARVRQCFGVPETVLDNRSSSFASAEQGDDQYMASTVRPMLWRDAEQVSELVEMLGYDPTEYFVAYDDPVLADREAEARIAQVEMTMGALSINEYRESVNLPPIKEGGDVYRINGVPLEFSGQPQAAPTPGLFTFSAPGPEMSKTRVPVVGTLDAKGNGDEQPEIRPQARAGGDDADAEQSDVVGKERGALVPGEDGDYREVLGRDREHAVSAGGGPFHGRARPVLKLADRHAGPDPYADWTPCGLCTKDDDDRNLIVPDEFITPEMAARQTAVLQGAVRTLGEIITDFMEDAKLDALRQIRSGAAIDLAELEESLANTLEPAFRDMYRAGFDLAGLELGEGADLDPFEIPNAEAVAEARTSLVRQFSRDIGDHTAQAIEGRIRAGIEEGKTIDEMTKEIEADTGFSRARSERIARTEVQRAANEGKRQRYKEAGVTKVYWVNAPGASAVHRAIAAMYSDGHDIDEPFLRAGQVVTGADGSQEKYDRAIYAPPARANCRCTIQTRKNDREDA